MNIAVIGAGYVGLVTAACLSEHGHRVTNADIDVDKIAMLKRGRSPIHEHDLEPMIVRNLQLRRLSFTDDVGGALEDAEVVFIAVGTPGNGVGFADLGYVMSAARTIGERLRRSAVIVVKSTVPPGTSGRIGATVRAALAARGLAHRIRMVSNPEFLREGCAVSDCLHPDRIVIGVEDAEAASTMRGVYAALLRRGTALIEVDPTSAELTKYAANAMLATRISLVNELAAIAEAVGADIDQVCRGIGSDHRIGPHFLAAGAGYGGSCFPKDMRALARVAAEVGVDAAIVTAAEQVNERQKILIAERIGDWYASRGGLAGRTVALWGLAFKPGTDDMREAPSLTVIEALLAAGARVRAHDPVALATAQRLLANEPRLTLVDDAAEALQGACALALVTEWEHYRAIAPETIALALTDRVVFDGRNALDAQALQRAGVQVFGIGKPANDRSKASAQHAAAVLGGV